MATNKPKLKSGIQYGYETDRRFVPEPSLDRLATQAARTAPAPKREPPVQAIQTAFLDMPETIPVRHAPSPDRLPSWLDDIDLGSL
jgi:hypothetical protein